MKQEISQGVVIAGILSLTAVELFALAKGIDGMLLTLYVGVIAAAIGVAIPTPKFK